MIDELIWKILKLIVDILKDIWYNEFVSQHLLLTKVDLWKLNKVSTNQMCRVFNHNDLK